MPVSNMAYLTFQVQLMCILAGHTVGLTITYGFSSGGASFTSIFLRILSNTLRPSSSVLPPTDHTRANKKTDCSQTCRAAIRPMLRARAVNRLRGSPLKARAVYELQHCQPARQLGRQLGLTVCMLSLSSVTAAAFALNSASIVSRSRMQLCTRFRFCMGTGALIILVATRTMGGSIQSNRDISRDLQGPTNVLSGCSVAGMAQWGCT